MRRFTSADAPVRCYRRRSGGLGEACMNSKQRGVLIAAIVLLGVGEGVWIAHSTYVLISHQQKS